MVSTHLLYSHPLLSGLHLSQQVHAHHRDPNMAGNVRVPLQVLLILSILLLLNLLFLLLLSGFSGGRRGLHLRICVVQGLSPVELLMGLRYSARVFRGQSGERRRRSLSHWGNRWSGGGGHRVRWSDGGGSMTLL